MTSGSPTLGSLAVRTMPITDMAPAEYNPRTISPTALDGLAESLRRFGMVQPVVWNERTGRIVGGHQRVEAMKREGVTHVDVVVLDIAETEEKALNIALNNPHISGEFTDDLQSLLEQVADEDRAMFDALRLDALLVAAVEQEPADAPDVQPHAVTQIGDVWVCGRHRVMCGSCDDAGHIDTLAPNGWDAAVVDPPFERDDLPGLTDPSIVFGQAKHIRMIPDDMWRFERVIDKVQGHRSATVQVLHRHAFVAQVGTVKRLPDTSQTYDSIITMDAAERSNHPHEKPVTLIVEHMRAWWPDGTDRVVDLCAGSGATMIACEMTGRSALCMEIDPCRVDVIVRRWQEHTGQTAVSAETGEEFGG